LAIEKLGGYLPVNALGPSNVTPLLVQMMEMGAQLQLFEIYYDLSYGRKPQVLLIIDVPSDVHAILQVSRQIVVDDSLSLILSFAEHCSMADA